MITRRTFPGSSPGLAAKLFAATADFTFTSVSDAV
jgi:hypothetical protein